MISTLINKLRYMSLLIKEEQLLFSVPVGNSVYPIKLFFVAFPVLTLAKQQAAFALPRISCNNSGIFPYLLLFRCSPLTMLWLLLL